MESALRFPIERIELDIRQASDGTIVLVHDDDVIIDGQKVPIENATTEQLREVLLDFMTFEEALAVIDKRMPVMIDLKKGNFVPELVALIERNGIAETAMISCTDPWAIRQLRAAFPSMPIGLSTGHRPLGLALKRGGPVVRNAAGLDRRRCSRLR
ncbi:MAG: glycerophosphodiester phosphodiesterase [Thermomicrobiales bacterium]